MPGMPTACIAAVLPVREVIRWLGPRSVTKPGTGVGVAVGEGVGVGVGVAVGVGVGVGVTAVTVTILETAHSTPVFWALEV